KRMAALQVEADFNLTSNVATGAYPISRMPLGTPEVKKRLKPDLEDRALNLIPHPDRAEAVADILGNVSLQYLLEAGVRVMLGTDGSGVEHSDIAREYVYATGLIDFW